MRLSQQPPSAALVIGILSVAAVALPAIGPQWIADGLTVQPALAQSGAWAFQETFDGAPGAPQPFSSPRWQVIAGSNNLDGIMDGQTVDATPEGLIQAGHGPDCGAPIGTAHNNHVLAVDFDLLGFQKNTRPHLAYVCNEHMMTTVKAGYGVVSFMPRQAFDWAGRTGTLEFETNVYSFGREWWDVYIVPDNEMLLEIVQRNEGGGGEQLPNRGVKFSFGSEKPSMQTIDNYQLVDDWAHWQRFVEAFPNDPALNDPKTRRVFRFQISQTGWGFNVQKQDGTLWSFSGNFSRPLSFTRGLVRIEHHSYNPTKDGIQGEPWSQYTFHWDNVRFDGPALGMRPAFGPGPHMLDLMHDPGPNNVQGVTINVPPGALNNPVLVGHVDSMLQNDDVDFQNRAHWRQFRVNGGAWQDLPLLKNVPLTNGDRGWSTFEVPVSGIVAGDNRIEFRYPTRPPQATWQSNGFRVKDVEIAMDPSGFTFPTATSIPTSISTPTQAAQQAPPMATASPTQLAQQAPPTATPIPTPTAPTPSAVPDVGGGGAAPGAGGGGAPSSGGAAPAGGGGASSAGAGAASSSTILGALPQTPFLAPVPNLNGPAPATGPGSAERAAEPQSLAVPDFSRLAFDETAYWTVDRRLGLVISTAPAAAVVEHRWLLTSETSTPPAGFQLQSAFEIRLTDSATGERLEESMLHPVAIYHPTPAELAAADWDLSRIKLAASNGGTWVGQPCSVDADVVTLTCSLLQSSVTGVLVAPPPIGPFEIDLTNGRFFKLANGFGGAGEAGFAVIDDGQAAFWTEFQRMGGVDRLGYPISRRFVYRGFITQAFQKLVLQWRPDQELAVPVNIFDDLSQIGEDGWLANRQIPAEADSLADSGLDWDAVVARHIALLDAYPALREAYVSDPQALELYGLPLAIQDFGFFVSVRLQRGSLQLWTVDTPWAVANSVVAANGGDIAKEAGAWPADVLAPGPPPPAALRPVE